MTEIRYTVIIHGEVRQRGLSLRDAAAELLLHNGNYEIRPGDDYGFWLWILEANKPWTRSIIYSIHDDLEAAESEIFQKVIDSGHWDSDNFTVVTDEHADQMLAEMDGDQ